MRGKLWLTTDLKATEVSIKVKASCRRFWGRLLSTEKVANDRLHMRNCDRLTPYR